MELHYLANPGSPHVKQWLELLPEEYFVTIFGIGEDPNIGLDRQNVTVISPVPNFFISAPKIFSYCYLGLWLRFFAPGSMKFIHAHNSSGYGFSAFLSGLPYILTTYGSEIFDCDNRGVAYRLLIKRVLNRAMTITATTEVMRSFLVERLKVAVEKIVVFSLGIAREFEGYSPIGSGRFSNSPVWISNRRILPHYCTAEIVTAFKRFKEAGGRGELWLLQGDASGDYTNKIRDAVQHSGGHIKFIEGFVSRGRLISLLRESHFSISIPISDQMSSSILESMSQGSVPMLRPLPAYKPVMGNSIYIEDEPEITDSLKKAFEETQAMPSDQWVEKSNECVATIREKYSFNSVQIKYLALIADIGAIQK